MTAGDAFLHITPMREKHFVYMRTAVTIRHPSPLRGLSLDSLARKARGFETMEYDRMTVRNAAASPPTSGCGCVENSAGS